MIDSGLDVGSSCIRACADDIGIGLVETRSLLEVFHAFREVGEVTKLRTKPKKCKIVVLGVEPEKRIFETKRWLHDCLPEWAGMDTVRSARYLGHFFGPDGHLDEWKAAEGKWLRRSLALAASGCAAPAAIIEYNVRIASVLQYLAMLSPLPASIIRSEKHLLHKIIHLPPNAPGHDEAVDVGFWGLPVLASVRASAAGASFRTAWRFRDTWEKAFSLLTEAAEMGIGMKNFCEGVRSPEHWLGPPFADFFARRGAAAPCASRRPRGARCPIIGKTSCRKQPPRPSGSASSSLRVMSSLSGAA